MKAKQFLLIISSIIIIAVGNVQGSLIWDSGNHVFSGGSEDDIKMYNEATATIDGGWIGEFYMYSETVADVTGGEIQILMGQDNSSVNVYDGSTIGLLRPNDTSASYVYGGDINHLFVLGNSTTNIYGGNFPLGFSANDSAVIKMYVLSYTWNPDGGSESEFGLLTGNWLNSGEAFSIDYVDLDCYDNIIFIPEPLTFSMCFSGLLYLVIHKKRN